MSEQRGGPTAENLLGPLEYEVMRELWREFPASVADVLERINDGRGGDDELAYTTVMTVLSRLHEKGYLGREKVGRGYQYRPRFTEEKLVERLGRREVDELLDRFGDVALAHFADALEEAAPAQIERLIELARRRRDA